MQLYMPAEACASILEMTPEIVTQQKAAQYSASGGQQDCRCHLHLLNDWSQAAPYMHTAARSAFPQGCVKDSALCQRDMHRSEGTPCTCLQFSALAPLAVC